MAVRSKKLAAGTSSVGGVADVYTCPSGHRTIVRSCLVMNMHANPQEIAIGIGPNGLANIVRATVPQYGRVVLTDWSVLHAGDTLFIYHSASTRIDFWASGAELVIP